MKKWWQEEVVYQIYPRSFQDSNGDGIGDIPGIISRLDEIKALGAGIIWLSPVYKSPDADNGYDISDYRDINPKFGTMADMDNLLKKAAECGIKIVMDLVINHTSDEHEWFQKSRDKESPYRDYYIWRKGSPKGKPPNNWTAFFMGSAWEYDKKSSEYYLHLFHKKQPDLNYHNPKVIEEIKDIMRFWLDKGVAGFRCDVINIIYKSSFADGKPTLAIRGIEHYKSTEGNHRILRELRRDVLDKYDCFAVGETVMVDLDEAKLLCDSGRKELDMLFYFDHLEVDRRIARYIPKKFHARKLLSVLAKWQQGLEWNAFYLENHDQPRIVSHYGDDSRYWERSAKMLATMQFTLGGTMFIYQGQEIGMTNFDFTELSQLKDVESHNINALMKRIGIPAKTRWHWINQASRDNARTPMQWSSEAGAGFTSGNPWIGINKNYKKINYQEQKARNDSILAYYKQLIVFRAGNDTLKYGGFKPVYAKGGVIAYQREKVEGNLSTDDEKYLVILNFSKKAARAVFNGTLVLSNIGRDKYDGELEAYEAVVLRV
ncbi:MAG: alpha-glucosidase [Lachnospiraceae bacterium]|nr:alpha-glucosidase [Lachnospiraceae bacterium]